MKRFLFALALLCLAPLARAGSYSTPEIEIPPNHYPYYPIVVPTFDASLGTLDSLQIVVDRLYSRLDYGLSNLSPYDTLAVLGEPSTGVHASLGINFRDGGQSCGVARNALPFTQLALAVYTGQVLTYHASSSAVSYNQPLAAVTDSAVLAHALWLGGWTINAWFDGVFFSSARPQANIVPNGLDFDTHVYAQLHVVYTYH